ncbi:bidirectional sugar transporter SWEET16-like [Brachypodium distachyon]|nr:bidirectional sugar transporter SWEET16-like [Brachypodium distachyon]|eukprot:XP_024312087.1 bidirectional sugar transporter SWEET16-like [Brachypodium distachyon]
MATEKVIKSIVSLLGYGFTIVQLFASGAITFRQIIQQGTVGEHTCYPYGLTYLNAVAWIAYGVPMHRWVLVTINTITAFVEAIYSIIYLVYSNEPKRVIASVMLLVQIIFTVVLISLEFVVFDRDHSSQAREKTYGLLGAFTAVFMYGSPVSDVVTVVLT